MHQHRFSLIIHMMCQRQHGGLTRRHRLLKGRVARAARSILRAAMGIYLYMKHRKRNMPLGA